ncbi:MAG TPA: molybdate ABC transporter substrate-binding protein [Burkholderiales bacterium]|nr:molybdate ABC transporter substrate-binding protein [Burkholderiales bacterium]
MQAWAGAAAADLVVSAAASLTNAFTDIGREFERAHPGTKVAFNFGGSGQLLQQIARGAPVDVFAAADQETMDRAQQQGLLRPGSRADFARNVLVLVIPGGESPGIGSLAELTGDRFRRVAIGNPDSVPVGRYSRSVLMEQGLWEPVKDKVINTQNVRQSLDYVARGEVDAAFVYRTDAALMPEKVKVALEVPTASPVLYPIAVIQDSSQAAAAAAFVAFVRATAGSQILQKYGFLKP